MLWPSENYGIAEITTLEKKNYDSLSRVYHEITKKGNEMQHPRIIEDFQDESVTKWYFE